MQRGLVYNKVNPIFHHWRVEDRKFGLTFQSPADAISFEKGLQAVIDKLDRGRETLAIKPMSSVRIDLFKTSRKILTPPFIAIKALTRHHHPHPKRPTLRTMDKL